MLGGAAGGAIASQVYSLVRQLERNAEFGGGPSQLDTFAFVVAFRGILFYGVLLIGLAMIVRLIPRCTQAGDPES